MPASKSDLLQGTLDLLILKIVAMEPIHGYGIALRIQQMSRDILQIQQGSLYPALYRLEERGYMDAEWRRPTRGAWRSSTSSPKKEPGNWRRSAPIGNAWW